MKKTLIEILIKLINWKAVREGSESNLSGKDSLSELANALGAGESKSVKSKIKERLCELSSRNNHKKEHK